MTLKIHTEEDEQRQLAVSVEVPEERVQAQMRRTARSLARNYHFPGFRRGKIPYNILVGRIGEQTLRADAVEEMLQSLLEEALEEIDAKAFYQPTLDNMELNPLALKITVPLEPKVILGDYRSIRKQLEEPTVTDEALEEALEHIRTHHQILEEVERPVEIGDMIKVTGQGKLDEEDGEVIWKEELTEMVVDPETVFPGIPFVENILGASTSDELAFQVTFPDDYNEEELSGKTATFEITIEQVQSRELPELTDELAQEEGDFETVEELIESVRDELQKQAETRAREELMDEMMDELLAQAEVVFPPAAVEREIDQALDNMKAQVERSGWSWSDYVKMQGGSEDAIRAEAREGAVERVRRGLVFRQFVKDERIKVEAEDIDEAVDKRLKGFGDNKELQDQLRSIFTSGEGLESVTSDVLYNKSIDRMEAIVTGNAPELDELDGLETQEGEEEE